MTAPIDRFIALVAESSARLDALQGLASDHLGYGPDEITWAHVGTAAHLNQQLLEIQQTLGMDAQTIAPDTPRFVVDGAAYSLAEMLSANRDDAELCEWARRAQPGDVFPAHNDCRRI